jgi:eukaryotic-like serine/threonine-protein kinase
VHTLVTSLAGARRYVVERELGHGGMGVVYQVLDLERNSRVALKALNKIDAVNIYRLKNEFRQLADLSHPNLVSLHELCCENELWFFTMELVIGETFDVYVTGDGSLPRAHDRALQTTLAGRARIVRDASVTLSQHGIGSEFPSGRVHCDLTRLRSALRQLVAAVAAIHEAGKLHRDIKPSNVLVTESGRVVVLDFGLVSSTTQIESHEAAAEHTIGGAVFGTPAYMSPEQAAGEQVGKASDWYSVGCMLYEALTGELPFEGSVLEILKRKDEGEPPAPSELVRGVPEDLNDLCCALLRRRPEERPTSAELQRIFQTSSLPPSPVQDREKTATARPGELFIGREPHLAALRRAFDNVKQGRPATVFVHGHSGMGKSALVRCFANELIKNQEAVVLRGRCYERESVPYKAFDDIVDALSRHMMRLPTEEASELLPRNIHALAHLFPVLKRVGAVAHARVPHHQPTDPHEIRQQAFGALKDLLARLSDWQPLVITIDDLQWGDMDSARMLAHLLGPPDPPPVLFIAVYRREEAETSPFLRALLFSSPLEGGIANTEQLAVDPLASDEAAHLARELLRDQPLADAEFARSISFESEGVPFFIGELAQHVKARAHKLPAHLGSVSLDGVISARVRELSPAAQHLLEVLSVAARPLEQGVALEAAGIPPGDREALLTLRAARLIRTRGTRQTDHAETYHDRVREAITAALPAGRVRDIHARVARASEVWGVGEPEQLVVHYAEAGEGGRAGETALQAARSAANKLAFNRAADLFRKAIELMGNADSARRRELYEDLGDALSNAGRGGQAAEAYLQAAAAANSAWDGSTLRRKAAQQLLRSGRVEEGTALLEQLLSEVGVGGFHSNARVLTRLLWNKSVLRFATFAVPPANDRVISPEQSQQLETLAAAFREVSAIDIVRGSFLHTQFLRSAIKAADPNRVLEGLAWEAVHLAHGQGVKSQARVERLLRKSDDLASQLATHSAQATVNLARAACYVGLARFREAYPLAREAERTLREHCPGTYWERSVVMSLRYACVELIGSLRELADEAYARAREANERDDGFSRAFLGVHAHMAQLMQGDADGALRALNEERSHLGKNFTTFHLWVMTRTVDAYNYRGDGAQAWEHLMSQWKAFEHTLFYRAQLYFTNAQYLYGRTAIAAFVATGTNERLKDARSAAHALHKLPRPDAQVYAHLIAAGIARSEESGARAAEELSAALFVARAQGYDMFALYAQVCLAEVDSTPGASAAAADALRELRIQGVSDPERWVAVYVPGFGQRAQ